MSQLYFLYADESGDIGCYNPTAAQTGCIHYAIAGIIIPVGAWQSSLTGIIGLRQQLKREFGFLQSEELHGVELFNPRGKRHFKNPKMQHRRERMKLYHSFMSKLPDAIPDARVLSVYLNKLTTKLLEEKWYAIAWKCLLERFHTFMVKQGDAARGIVVTDEGNQAKLRPLLRKLRKYNPIASKYNDWYDNPLNRIIEDPFERQSQHSYFIQAADMIVHALYRQENPKGSHKRYNAERLFRHISSLTIKEAAGDDPLQLGIKRI